MHRKALFLLAVLAALSGNAVAAVLISQINTETEITFDAVMSGVWGGTTPNGSGFGPTPNGTGIPYDSHSWAARAGSAPDLTLPADGAGGASAVGFGGTSVAGAVQRGVSTVAGWTAAGLGLATGLPTGNGIALKPGSIDNATVFLKIQNTTGMALSNWTIDYDAFYIDIGVYATPVSFAYSTDGGANFSSAVGGLSFSTPGQGTVTTPTVSDWTSVATLAPTVINAAVADDGYLILRWVMGGDIPSGQLANRVALDNISILGSPAVPEPGSLGMLVLGGLCLRGLRRARSRVR